MATAPLPEEPLLTSVQVSQWLNVSLKTLRRWAEQRQFPAFWAGSRLRFRRADILAWLEQPEGRGDDDGRA